MALDRAVRTAADTVHDQLAADLVARQAGVKGTTSRYRQQRRASRDTWGTWETVKPDPVVADCAVNVYDGPQGVGYEVESFATDVDGKTVYRRVTNVGPETHRTRAWTQLAEG